MNNNRKLALTGGSGTISNVEPQAKIGREDIKPMLNK